MGVIRMRGGVLLLSTLCSALLLAAAARAGEFEILYDSFESPDISGQAGPPPPGWIEENSYSVMLDEDSGDFTTPFGSQVIGAWSSSGFQTTNITDRLQPGATYTLTFNAGNVNADTGQPRTDNQYTAYLLAGTNVLATVTGVTTNNTLSQSNLVSVATGETHPHLGKTLGVRLRMTGGDYHAKALFDNVRLVVDESGEWARSLFYGK